MKTATVRELEVPPLGVRLRYRFFSLRVPEEWREWAERDIRSSGWPVRESVRLMLTAVFLYAVLSFGPSMVRDGLGEGLLAGLERLPMMLFFVFIIGWGSLARIVRDPERARARAIRYQSGDGPHPWRSGYGSGFEAPPLPTILGWVFGGLLIGGLLSLAIIVFLV